MRGRRLATAIAPAALLLIVAGTAPAQEAGHAQSPPDGQIVFTSNRCDEGGIRADYFQVHPPTCVPRIFRVGLDGSDMRPLTPASNSEPDIGPVVMPDGRIMFMNTSEPYGTLEVMNRDGSDRRPFTLPGGVSHVRTPDTQWSPGGDRLLYDEVAVGTWLADADGSNRRHVAIPDGMVVGGPLSFTADGRHLVFVGYHGVPVQVPNLPPDPRDTDWGTWMMDLDGTNPVRLTVGDVPGMIATEARFAPDGQHFALALSKPSGNGSIYHDNDVRHLIYTARIDGSELAKRNVVDGFDPTWVGSSTLVYLGPPTNDRPDIRVGGEAILSIYRVGLDGRPPVPVTPPTGVDNSAVWDPAGGLLRAPKPPVDVAPPALDVTAPGQGSGELRAAANRPRDRLEFLAVDRSGIRRVDAAVGLRVHGRCRFLGVRKLGPRRRCDRPQYTRADNRVEWRKRTAHLPKGTYEVRFRATDAKGNRTRHPRRRVVKLP